MRVFAAECANTERVISSKRALSDNKRIRAHSGGRNGNHSDRRFFRLLFAKLAICRNICPIYCLMDRPCFYKSYFSLFCDSNAIDNLHFLTMCTLVYIPTIILFSFNRSTHYGNQIKLAYISYFLLLILLLSQSKLSHTVYRRLERGGQI